MLVSLGTTTLGIGATLGLALALLSVYVVAVVASKLWAWSTWVRDVPGPERTNFILGSWAEFAKVDLVEACVGWMREYGGVVRIWAFFGEPRLLVSDPVTLDHILSSHAMRYPKPDEARRALSSLMGQGLIAVEGSAHSRIKRAMQPGFAAGVIKSFSPVFVKHSVKLRDMLLEDIPVQSNDNDGKLLCDILRPISRATLDALGSAGFDYSFGALDEPGLTKGFVTSPAARASVSTNPLSRAFDVILNMTSGDSSLAKFAHELSTLFFPVLAKLPIFSNRPAFWRARAVLDSKAAELVERARRDIEEQNRVDDDGKPVEGATPPRKDFLASLMRANAAARESDKLAGQVKRSQRTTLEKATLSDAELVAQISTLMFAGFETSANQLTWILLALSLNQDVQAKLRQAIRAKRAELGLIEVPQPGDTSDEAREMTMDEMDDIDYLDWVVKEGLRFEAAIHTVSRRACEDDVLPVDPSWTPKLASKGGLVIKKGTFILIPIAAICKDPRLWGEDAAKFRPERWAEPTEGSRRFARVGGFTFLSGARACIGNRFAVNEIKVLLAILVNSIHFEGAGHRIVPHRWIVSRPWDCKVGVEQCPVRLSKAPPP